MMNANYLGIDPGLSGGLAVVSGNKIKYKMAMPTINFTTKKGKTKKGIDRDGVLSFLYTLQQHTHVVIEKQDAYRSQNITSSCTTCQNYGGLLMALTAAHLYITEVTSKVWHEYFSIVNNKTGGPFTTKVQAFEICKRLFPDDDFRKTGRSKVFHDGIIDACLLSVYCKELFEERKTNE